METRTTCTKYRWRNAGGQIRDRLPTTFPNDGFVVIAFIQSRGHSKGVRLFVSTVILNPTPVVGGFNGYGKDGVSDEYERSGHIYLERADEVQMP